MQPSGAPRLIIYPSGTGASSISYLCPSVVPFTAGQRGQIKITLDVDNGSGQSVVTFLTATDGSTFTTLGTATGTVTSLLGTTATNLQFNVSQGGSEFAGKLYRFIVRNGIGGTTVFDADFTTGITSGAQTTFTESSANAATVTISRATSGRKSVAVTRPILLFGTDDYLEVADNDLLDFAASDSFTVVAIQRVWATQSTARSLIAKKADLTAATQGWALSSGSTTALQGQMQVGDATNGVTSVSASRTNGTLQVISGARNTATDTVTTWLNNTAGTSITDTTTSTSANAEVMRIGRLSGAGTGYTDMELVAAAVWRRALNANEIATIVNRYT